MKHKTVYTILLILSIISLLSSIVLSFAPTSQACQIGQISEKGCESVKNSSYNYTLGIQNSYYGVAIFALLSLILYSQLKNPNKKKEKYIRTSLVVGSIIALYFILLQIFIIEDYCQYCLVVDFSILLSLLVSTLDWKFNKK